jgi:long-chain acyl-CoA synthetase
MPLAFTPRPYSVGSCRELRLVQTIAELFYEALRFDLPDALASKAQGAFRPVSHADLRAAVERLALALEARGLRAGDRVAILSENRPEWAITDFTCAVLGLVSVPVYPSLTPDQTAHILRDSGARWVLVSTQVQLAKVLSVREHLPDLETLLVLDGEAGTGLSWTQLLAEGEALEDRREQVRSWARERRPEELLTLIYTSGTTGDPKGAMLSQGNVASNIVAVVEVAGPTLAARKGDRCLSVLPLSHIFERTAGHYTMFHLGIAIYYCESLLSLPQNLLEVRPSVLMAVPRIFEKIYARVRDVAATGGFLKRLVFRWAVDTCHRVVRHLYLDRRPPLHLRLPWRLADRILLSKVRAKTGGNLRFCVTGGAALNARIAEFFWAMGVPIYEGYGLSETSPILTLNRKGKVRPGFVGHPLQRTWRDRPFLRLAPDGEILCQGPNVMLGYWRNEAASREMFDAEGYFRTGDVGEIDPQGRVKITDRKKEILVTSGGKNVAPQPIEALLMADPYIEQAVLVGDHRNHLAALVVPHFPALRAWCERRHLVVGTDAEMVVDPRVRAKLMDRVTRVNAHLPVFQRVRRIALLEKEMTAENGLLTPSLKVKRRVVNEAYRDLIEDLYRSPDPGNR